MRWNHKDRIERLKGRHPDVVSADGAMHRRHQLLVSAEQSELAAQASARFLERVETYDELGVHRLWLRASDSVDVPEFALGLRGQGIRVTPNHVLRGAPVYDGGPFGAPTLCDPIPAPMPTGIGREVRVAVLDTGIAPHPWFTSSPWWSQVKPDQLDPVSVACDYELGAQDGHGTFVAGVVLKKAPDAQLWIERVLDDLGVCDELELIQGLHRVRRREEETGTQVDVINLSLGGYAHHDHPSHLVAEALRKFGNHTVIVTAAGNNSSDRTFWPAALKDCVAVGSKNEFSDRGWWVDAHARAEGVTGPFAGRTTEGEIELGFARWSGTSFAAPHVAGAIARMANEKDITARQAAEILLDTAGPRPDPELGVEIG